MMVGQRTRKTREFRGPAPQSVAIRAKFPSKRPADYRVQESRRQEEIRNEMLQRVMDIGQSGLEIEMEERFERRIVMNSVNKEVNNRLKTHEFNLEDRRDRLRDMLAKEEADYLVAMEAQEETLLERQAKMRERAKLLKDRREAERLSIVQEKYDQQFREKCEELRSTLSKREQDIVCVERLEQLRLKEEGAREEKAYEDMYAQLWEKDRQEKIAREEREALASHGRNIEMVNVLRQQMGALEVQKEEAKRLQKEETELMKEQLALRKLEEAAALEEKRRRQQETRDMLDMTLKMKLRKKAREEQEQLAFDLKLLEKLLEESHNEAIEQLQRKKELREEDRRYREYLTKMVEEEKERERELERAIHEETEAVWQKRLDQWRKERMMRRKLLDEVIAGRRQQVENRLLENERQKAANIQEGRELMMRIEENRRLDAEKAAKRHAQNVQYQNDLQSQMDYNAQLREDQRRRDEYEQLMGMQAEHEYQARLKDALDNAAFTRLHPMRRAMLANQ